MSAIISKCGMYRYRLERDVQPEGLVFGYFGVNGSTATATEDDHTVRKWIGFTKVNGGRRFIVGNAFAFRATDVRELATAVDPVGPENEIHLERIIGTVAKLAMRQPFVLFKGLTFQKLCLPGAFRPGDHHNKMLRPGLCVVHASPQYL